MSKLKALDYGTLVAKMESNNKAIAALEAANVTDHVAPLKVENEEIVAELAGRKGEMLIAAVAPAMTATLTKELAGKEADLDARTVITTEILKDENGVVTFKHSVGGAKKARVATEGGVSSGNRGERKGAKVVTLTDEVVTGNSASEVMKKLQDMKQINPNEGIGDSAVRVLSKAQKNGFIKSFEQFELPKEEKAKAEPVAQATGEVASTAVDATPSIEEEKSSKKK